MESSSTSFINMVVLWMMTQIRSITVLHQTRKTQHLAGLGGSVEEGQGG